MTNKKVAARAETLRMNIDLLDLHNYGVPPHVIQNLVTQLGHITEAHTKSAQSAYDSGFSEGAKDELTGLKTLRNLREAFEGSDRRDHADGTTSLIFLDVIGLKQVNNDLGQGAGNALLEVLAEQLKLTFKRETDIVARIGGDEFAVVLKDTSASFVKEELPDILKQMQNKLCVATKNGPVPFGFRYNAMVLPEHHMTVEEALAVVNPNKSDDSMTSLRHLHRDLAP